MPRLLIAALLLAAGPWPPASGAGKVTESITQLGVSPVYVITFFWTGDASTGSVPVTAATGACDGVVLVCSATQSAVNLAGMTVLSVETAPRSPAPSAGYGVQILDISGTDILAGGALSCSSTQGQSWIPSPSAPPLTAAGVSLSVSSQSAASAQGTVYVFIAPTTSLTARSKSGGSSGAKVAATGYLLKGDGNGNAVSSGLAAAAASIVNLFSGCSGTLYLGADGACHTLPAGGGSSLPFVTTDVSGTVSIANGTAAIFGCNGLNTVITAGTTSFVPASGTSTEQLLIGIDCSSQHLKLIAPDNTFTCTPAGFSGCDNVTGSNYPDGVIPLAAVPMTTNGSGSFTFGTVSDLRALLQDDPLTAGAGIAYSKSGATRTLAVDSTQVPLKSGACPWTATDSVAGCAVLGGASGFVNSQGNTGAVSMTGSDVTLWSIASVPALASGACYFISYEVIGGSAGGYSTKLYVDSTDVQSLGSMGSNGEYDKYAFSYCNQAGSQTAQYLNQTDGAYCASACGAGAGFSAYLAAGGATLTPTGVTWSSTHTIAIKANTASGTVTGTFFRIGQ
jgi:hypothetical protein